MKNRGNIDVSTLLDSDVSFGVLESQRNFAWRRDEADEFYCDLLEFIDQERKLFLGTIVINTSESMNLKKELIVDGQQRFTTINLFLIACRQRAKELGEERVARKIQQKIFFTDKVTDEDKVVRFEASPSINDVFQHMASYDWDSVIPVKIGKSSVKRQVKLISPVYEYFEAKIKEKNIDELQSLLRTLYDTAVARIDVNDNAEALGVFERLNARGVGLVISDLLKNELFRTIPNEARESWQTIVDNSYGSTERMLKYFYVSQKGYVKKTDLFRKLKEISKETSTKQLLENLEDFSNFYNVFSKGSKEDLRIFLEENSLTKLCDNEYSYDEVYLCIEALRLFKITQFYPLIYSALFSIKNCGLQEEKDSAKKFIKLLKMLEKYHFINNYVCERIGNEIEKPYANFASKFYTGDFNSIYNEVEKFINDTKAKEQEFVSKFIEIYYDPQTTIPQLMYIFDRFSNHEITNAGRIKIYNPLELKKRNHNLEHFYPQTPSAELQAKLPKPENIDSIGNLIGISSIVNLKLGNKTPVEKINELSSGSLAKQIQNHFFVKEFVDGYGKFASEWNDSHIAERANDMAVRAYKEIWKI
ncbi:MAG: DUF262 domain-containing protein [bacterium]|nr:DUF262 domain-containing protein [bacterium]